LKITKEEGKEMRLENNGLYDKPKVQATYEQDQLGVKYKDKHTIKIKSQL